jgi:hypothetical protein
VHGKPTNLDTVTTSDVLDQGCLADDLDELLAGVAVLVEVADIAGGHFFFEGDAD